VSLGRGEHDETEKQKRETAEAQVAELRGIVRASREDEHLVAALRRAGAPELAAKDAASAMRRKASIAFDENSGAIDFGEIDDRCRKAPVGRTVGFGEIRRDGGCLAATLSPDNAGEYGMESRLLKVGP
jgi:hypothetical protein